MAEDPGAAPPGDAAAAVAAAVPENGGSLADYVIEARSRRAARCALARRDPLTACARRVSRCSQKAIGRGHFSTVHRAVRRSDERRVALKKVQIFDMLDAKASASSE